MRLGVGPGWFRMRTLSITANLSSVRVGNTFGEFMKSVWKLIACAALVGATMAGFASTGVAASDASVPPLDAAALREAISGLPGSQLTAALAQVAGPAGHWSGAAGTADLAEDRPAHADDAFRIGSVSKVFMAAVVLQLVAEHRVSLDRPVQDYLPGLLPAGDPPITVAELLDHTSGLGEADGIVDSGDPTWFLAHRLDRYTTDQLLGNVLSQPLVFAPGSAQQYNGVNYLVLAMLVQKVSGHDYAYEIEQRILRPLGLRHTVVPTSDPAIAEPHLHGYYPAASGAGLVDITEQNPSLYGAQGGMISTASDLNIFLTALLGGRLLPRAELTDMLTVPSVATGSVRYGMGLLRYTLPDGTVLWGHTGETPGYVSAVFGTQNQSRVLAFAFTPVGQPSSSQVLADELKIVSAAYEPTATAGG